MKIPCVSGKADTLQEKLYFSKEISIEIGDLLKKARHEKNLNLDDIAKRIHIRKLYLQYIEDGMLELLPGDAYVAGFVKTYAFFLGCDGSDFVRRIIESDPTFLKDNHGHLSSQNYHQKTGLSKQKLSYVSVALTLAFFIFMIDQFFEKQDENQKQIMIPDPLAESQQEKISTTVQDETASQVITDEPPSQPTEMVIPAQPQKGTEIRESDIITKPTVFKVIILDETWMEIRNAKGDVITSHLFKTGENIELDASSHYFLTVGNAAGIRLGYGDREKEGLGRKGKVLRHFSLNTQLFEE